MNSFHCLENIHKEKRLTESRSKRVLCIPDFEMNLWGFSGEWLTLSCVQSPILLPPPPPPPLPLRIGFWIAHNVSVWNRAGLPFLSFAVSQHTYITFLRRWIYFLGFCVSSVLLDKVFLLFFFLFVFCPSRGLRQRDSLLFYIVFVATAIYDASIFLVNYSHIFFLKFFFSFGFSIRREMEDHNELDDRNSLT